MQQHAAAPITAEAARRFRRTIYAHFAARGRDLPWRKRRTPYRVLVAEVMLQQTQAARVAVFFPRFVRAFPSFRALASARRDEVLRAWQGLGYNRRAVALHRLAEIICARYHGRLPSDPAVLRTLPGLGEYTSASVAVFAFNAPHPLIETNIRAVFTHLFFPKPSQVSDEDIRPLVTATLDRRNPSRWFDALMDYGADLKGTHREITRRSLHYRPQSRFEGSVRQKRGALLRLILKEGADLRDAGNLARQAGLSVTETTEILQQLKREGFLSS